MNLLKNLLYFSLPFKAHLGRALVSPWLDQPIFVVGSGRSGTTVLGQSLNSHPVIAFSPNEAPLGSHIGDIAFQYSAGEVKNWYKESISLPERNMRETLRRVFFESVWGEFYGLRPNIGVFKGGWKRSRTIEYWGTKTFPTESGADGIEWLFPKVKYIYIIRNGLDVIQSMSKFPGFANRFSFEERCRFWVTTVDRYDYLRHRPNAITVRFEDLVDKPGHTFEAIQNHIGVEFSSNPFRFASTTIIHPLDQPTIKANPAVEFSKRPASYLTWSDTEKEIFRSLCGPSMALLGYKTTFPR